VSQVLARSRSIPEVVIPSASRPWVAAATAFVIGSLAITGWVPGFVVVAAFFPLAWLPGWRFLVVSPVVVLALWLAHPPAVLEPGPIETEATVTGITHQGQFRPWATAEFDGTPVFLELPVDSQIESGSTARLSGVVTERFTPVQGRPHQVIRVEQVGETAAADSYFAKLGLQLRTRVATTFAGKGEPAALLAGFLVGDVSGLGPATVDAMKLAGLSHFVAVSGSNVALFLALVYLLAAPLGVGVRARAAVGLISLPIFVFATGLEPSVVRASVMAAIVLGGVLLGIELEIWQVMSLAVAGLLLADPWLIRSVGFQLSVAATAGVIAGSRWPGVTTGIGRALSTTSGAQLAVAPILLAHFGSIPLLSPLSNLVAAPLVTLATVLAVPAVVGVGPTMFGAEALAALVIQISRTAASWPQIGWAGVVLVAALGGIAIAFSAVRKRRAPVLAVGALVLAAAILGLPGGGPPQPGTVVVLDVGQGDAILLSGGPDNYALVDGGPDEAVLLRQLRSRGVKALNLVVMTHGDADHAAGLAGLFGSVAIGAVWERTTPHPGMNSGRVLELASRYGVPVAHPSTGDTVRLGSLEIEVIGPQRRYRSANDQSIVLLVKGEAATMLLTGDIEVVAQQELPRLVVDVLKVPHHGGGTSDANWLEGLGAERAVISVGDNTFGHPVEWVVAALERSGATVSRTDLEGSVVVDLNG
jgi:competence protein ComEC